MRFLECSCALGATHTDRVTGSCLAAAESDALDPDIPGICLAAADVTVSADEPTALDEEAPGSCRAAADAVACSAATRSCQAAATAGKAPGPGPPNPGPIAPAMALLWPPYDSPPGAVSPCPPSMSVLPWTLAACRGSLVMYLVAVQSAWWKPSRRDLAVAGIGSIIGGGAMFAYDTAMIDSLYEQIEEMEDDLAYAGNNMGNEASMQRAAGAPTMQDIMRK
eukprot:gene29808-biopygen5547